MLLGGKFSTAVLGVDLRGLAALLRLPGQHLENILIGEFAGLLSGHLFGLDGSQQHPQRRGT